MTSCSHHGDQGCVPQAASATPIASASSSRARRCSISLRAASGNDSAAPRLDLDLRRDQLARRVLAERRGVGARLELGEAVDQAERLRVDDLELLLDREGEILRAGEVGARLVQRQQRVGDALAHRREPTSALVLQPRTKSADTCCMERSRRSYFLLLGLACAAAGPRDCGPCRSWHSPSSRSHGRSASAAGRCAILGEVEVERVQ